MELKEKFVEFFKSDDKERTFKNEKGKEYILTKHDLNNNLFALYFTAKKDKNDFSGYNTEYLATIEKNSLEIIHCDYSNMLYSFEKIYKYDSYDDISRYSNLESKLKNDIENLLAKILENGRDTYYKQTNLSKYQEKIKDFYTQKKKAVFPSDMVEFNLDFNKICDYHKNPKMFLYKHAKLNLTERNIDRYKEYLALTDGLAAYTNQIENDDEGKIKKTLLEIMSNDKYKNVKIRYKYPDGTASFAEFSKNNHYVVRVKNDIFDRNKIENIPIYSIEQVTWGRSTLYDKKSIVSDRFEYKEEQQVKDFIESGHSTHLPVWVYSDKECIDRLFDTFTYNAFKVIEPSLLEDKKFVKDLIEKHKLVASNVLNSLTDTNLIKDKEFVLYVIDNSIDNSTPCYTKKDRVNNIIDKIDDTLLSDIDIAKKLFGAVQEINAGMIEHFPDKIILNKEIIDIMKTKQLNDIKRYIGRFKTTEILLNLFSKEDLQNNIYNIDFNLLTDDKALVLTLLDDMTSDQAKRLFYNEDNNFVYFYKDDEDVMSKVCKIISGDSSIEQLADILGIKNPDNEAIRIYELAADNVEFLTLFEDEKRSELYFSGEAGEATRLVDFNIAGKTVTLDAAYGRFKINIARYSRPKIYFEDNNNHEMKVSSSEVEKILFENIKEICHDTTSETMYDLIINNSESILSLVNEKEMDER